MKECCEKHVVEHEKMHETVDSGNRFAGRTDYWYYTCSKCGTKWTKYRDSGGVTGTDTFWREGHIEAS